MKCYLHLLYTVRHSNVFRYSFVLKDICNLSYSAADYTTNRKIRFALIDTTELIYQVRLVSRKRVPIFIVLISMPYNFLNCDHTTTNIEICLTVQGL